MADSGHKKGTGKLLEDGSREEVADKAEVNAAGSTAAKGAKSSKDNESSGKSASLNQFARFLDEYRKEVGAMYIQTLDEDYIRPLAKVCFHIFILISSNKYLLTYCIYI